MSDFEHHEYRVFEMFHKQMPLVTAGSIDHFNGCTLGWGSLGNIWSRGGSASPIVTVYVHPARYTCDFLKASDTFTLCFLPPKYREAIAYMGSHSGRNENKAKNAGLTPVPLGGSVMYEEAALTFLCKKLYQHPFCWDDLHPEIQAYYTASPRSFPPGEDGEPRAHWMFIGQVIDTVDRR